MNCFWWIPALIPLLGAFGILVSPLWPISKGQGASGYERGDNWKKFGLYLLVNVILCVLVAVGMWWGATGKTRFPEVWHFKVTDIRHEHKWTTHETRTETYTTGSGKNQQTHTRTVHYTDTHGPYWNARVNGFWCSIDQSTYDKWKKFWGNERQTGMHDGSSAFGDRSIDGPIMECKWPGSFETIYPWSEIHKYVNKIRVSQSVLQYGEPTEQQLKRFPRPADNRNTSPVINYGGPSFSADDKLLLRRVNAVLGPRFQVHTMLVTFPKDSAMDVMHEVLTAWGGPNKNELCTFICLDGETVKWVSVESWMDDKTLHATLRDEIMGEPFTVGRYAALLQKHVPKLWRRKEFTPINEYLSVPINPIWMIVGIVLALVMGVVSFLIIEYKVFEGRGSFGGYRYGRFR